MSEHLATLVCQTVQAVFVSEQDLELQIRIHVEKNEASHHLVDLLKMGIITWKHPSCKVLQSKGVCEGCCKTFATTQGEIHMCLGVSANSKCPDCLQNSQDMEKTFAENAEFCDHTEKVVKEGHLTSKNDDDDEEVNDTVCKEENDDNHEECVNLDDVNYTMEKKTSARTVEREVCGRTYHLQKTLKRHQQTSHTSSELEEVMGNVGGDVDATEITDHSMDRSTVTGNVSDGKVMQNADKSVDAEVIFVERNQNDRYIRPYKCEVCGISYMLMKTLRRHKQTSHKSSELTSHKSSELTELMGSEVVEGNTDQDVGATVVYVKRKRNDSNIRPYKCEVCSRTYQLKKTLKRHQQSSHTSSELEVVTGNVGGDVDSTEITDHKMDRSTVKHEHDELTGNVSDGEVTQNTDQSVDAAVIFVERNQNDRYIRPYKCEVCGRTYQFKKSLKRHKQMSHKSSELTSHKSSELTELMGNEVVAVNTDQDVGATTIVHVKRKRNDSNIRPYKCEVCTRTYQFTNTLKRHQRTSHTASELEEVMGNVGGDVKRTRTISNIRPYECEECGNTYQMLASLKSHEQTHQIGKYCCGVCGREYHLKSRLMYHLRFHTGERPFKCTICSSSFMNKYNLTRHLKTHDKEPAYTCSKCGKGFTEACYLAIHERTHSGERPYQCHVCGKCFTNASSVKVHQAVHINDRTYKCEICPKTFKTLRDVRVHKVIHTNQRSHKVIHTNQRSYVCEICGSGFITQSGLTRHKKLHGKRPFACKICLKTFLWKSYLRAHAVIHSDDKPFKCGVCDKSFSRKSFLKVHSGLHSSNKPFMCELCGKSFRLIGLLRSHFRTHSGYRPHACDICGRKYRSIWYMQVHRKTHTGENLIQCNDCGDWFVNPSYFKLHQRKHCKGGKVVYCSICNHKFSSNRELEKHKGIHTGERPFGCEICGVAFSKKASLQDHIKRHTQKTVHKCGTCGKGFKRATCMRKHEKRHTKMMKALLLDEMKPGHKNDIAALQKDVLQQLTDRVQVTESMQVRESISDANEPGYVDVVQLPTINNGQFQQNQEVVFLESDRSQHVEARGKMEIDHPCISGVLPIRSIQTSEGVPPSQSFTTTDGIIIQVDHQYISSQTGTSDGVQIQALTTEACGVVSSADHTEISGSKHSDTAISIGVEGRGTGTGATPDTDT